MIGIVAGFVIGLGLAGLAFWLAGGGLIGLGLGAVCAALGYVAGSTLLQPERRLGKVVVSALPNGQKAAAAIDDANTMLNRIGMLARQVRDPQVRSEADDFIAATRDLTRYVSTDTGAYATLRHYTNVYGDQTAKLLKSYVDVEQSGARDQLAVAQRETVEALQVLERTAAGELSRAVSSKTLGIAADSEAIQRLASMDGYATPDDDDGHVPAEPDAALPAASPAALPSDRPAAPEDGRTGAGAGERKP
ncbi:5-bromo-4-chloroindolyl phosphate hydrolysis family protein [Bifidobacterium miconis]|uniref:5-bromo-4-chloroindolyl phosphate hydrolysis family protein n=1 Tax=Bifidobacterium miconis TaxID=2834435 RepID=UPI001F352639|nr:5-bromo-4-chloroindolyl phosphate hydrolysis family protein [Bifidobacterium miconis]